MTKKLKFLSRFMCWGLVSILAALFLFIAISFGVAVDHTKRTVDVWYKWQDDHIAELTTAYENGTAPKINEADFCDFDYDEALTDGTKLNELRYLATHNSYKMGVSKQTDFFYNHALPLIMGKQYDYVFDTITEQFNQGIRSIEIDINKVRTKDGFVLRCVHSPILEQQSSMIDMRKGIQEMKMWSDYNPEHLPIIILVEPKNGDNETFDLFEDILVTELGDKLLTPADVMGDYASFKEVRAADAYPTLGQAKGKFLVVLHEKPGTFDTYINRDKTVRSQKMFLATAEKPSLKNSYYLDRSLFLIYNEKKHFDKIVDAIDNGNFMVRTRLDQYALIDADRKELGLRSGAQIMSSDYPYTSSNRYDYVCQIAEGNKTMILKK